MKKRQIWGMIVMILLTVLFIVVGSITYLNSVQASLWQQSADDVLDVTAHGGHAFEIYIEKEAKTTHILTGNLTKLDSTEESGIFDVLDVLNNEEEYYVVYNLDRGVYYADRVDGAVDIGREEWERYAGLPDKGVLEPYINKFNGQLTLGYFERFTFADGQAGIIRRGELVSDISREFSLSFYDNAGFSYVINAQGDVLFCTNDRNSDRDMGNIFDVIAKEKDGTQNAALLENALGGGERGTVSLAFAGKEHLFAYVPLQGTDGWHVISIVPSDVILKNGADILSSSRIFVFAAVIVVLILVGFAITISIGSRNVREQKLEVKYREQLFDVLAKNTDDVFLLLNTNNCNVEYISPNVERILGIPAEDVAENVDALELTEERDGRSLSYRDLYHMEHDASRVTEGERVHRKTGERRWFRETMYRTTIEDADKFIVQISDRTAERRSKEILEDALSIARAANESKSTFLSNMSHDIRTPMNAIVGLCTLLQRDADSPERVRNHIRKIAASSQHLLGVINDVLDMSKIESGKTTLNISDFFLGELVEQVETIIRSQARAKQQEFQVNTVDVKTEHFQGDKLRIGQVLLNILSNAVKYTPEGGSIRLTIRQLAQSKTNYASLRFTVSDNGCGMSEEYLERIFEPFTREECSTTNRIQGTGLGMAITKSLVDLMGGTIQVESHLQQGSVFTVDLELRTCDADLDGAFWKRNGIASMLAVSTDEETGAGIAAAMAETGVSVCCAADGSEAVSAVAEAHREGRDFDLILLDYRLPDMDGIEAAVKIRETLTGRMPMLLMAAYDCQLIEKRARIAGVDGVMPKPFFVWNFKQAIEAVASRRDGDSSQADQENPLEGMQFLMAEDNELNAEILVEILSMVGAGCDVAGNGRQAVEMFERSEPGQYDMILMDVQMPVMNGYDAARDIRAGSHPCAADIPIIAITANAFVEDIQEAKAAGMNAHIAKPVVLGQLEAAVREIRQNRTKPGGGEGGAAADGAR